MAFLVAGCLGTEQPTEVEALPEQVAEEDITTISQLDIVPEQAVNTLAADVNEIGFFDRLRGKAPKSEFGPLINAADLPDTRPLARVSSGEAGVEVAALATDEQSDKPRRGLFGFGKKAEISDADKLAAATAAAVNEALAESDKLLSPSQEAAESVRLASLPSEKAVTDAGKKPLFGSLFAGQSKPQAAPTGAVAFGVLVKDCSVKKSAMGKKTDQLEAGSPRFALYDSDPTSKEQRDFYVVGFKDKCARKFKAAVAMFGDLHLHEIKRYSLSKDALPYSNTDKAYEVLKARYCGAKKGEVCGDKKMPKLTGNTAFLTVYESFGGSGDWAEILLHKGDIYASSVVAHLN
jgi:hypothetical protein